MNRYLKAALIAVGATVLATGCAPECEDVFDCADRGENFVCVDQQCVEKTPVPPTGDGGSTDAGRDAGTTPDSGTDAGGGGSDAGDSGNPGPSDAGDGGNNTPDAGDAGPQPLTCATVAASCDAGFTCNDSTDGGDAVCRSRYFLAHDQGGATLLRSLEPTQPPIILSATGRDPRFNPNGSTVAYVEGTAIFRFRLDGGENIAVITDAGNSIQELEYAPTSALVWRTTEGALQTADNVNFDLVTIVDGGTRSPDWAGQSIAHLSTDGGLLVSPRAGPVSTTVLAGGASQPKSNRAGTLIAFISDGGTTDDGFDGVVSFVPVAGGNVVRLSAGDAGVLSAVGGIPFGTPGFYHSDVVWSPVGNRVAIVRAAYNSTTAVGPSACTGASCPGVTPSSVIVVPVDVSGAQSGPSTFVAAGFLPSFSQDGRFLSVVVNTTGVNNSLVVYRDELDGGFAPVATHNVNIAGRTDDDRPRWQPLP